ncbi:MAG: hypothetical protein AAF871_04320 [Pseudomonadota bacterium]
MIEIWKKTVEVQQHFNEICMKIRNLYVSTVTALIAVLGLILWQPDEASRYLTFGELTFHASALVFAGIFFISMIFYFIDLHWYHRLLIGAVKNGIDIEDAGNEIPGLKLTKRIGEESPLNLNDGTFGSTILGVMAGILQTDRKTQDEFREGKLHSSAKLAVVYKSVAYLAAVMFFVSLIWA